MPKKVLEFTDEEKASIKKDFDINFEYINKFFKTNGLKELNYEDELNKLNAKLNDERNVKLYRLANEVKEKKTAHSKALREAEETITNELKAQAQKEGKDASKVKFEVPSHKDYLSRDITFMMKTDGSEESKIYNINLLKTYAKNPEAFTHNEMKKVLSFDPKPVVDLGNDEVKLMEYCKDNIAFCTECQDIWSASCHSLVTPEFKEALNSIKGLTEKINRGDNLVSKYSSLAFLTLPDISKDKASMLFINKAKIKLFPPRTEPKTFSKALDVARGVFDTVQSPAEYYQKLQAKGLVIDKDLFLKYKCVETNPKTGEKHETSFDDLIEGKENVTFELRTPEELKRLGYISKQIGEPLTNEFSRVLGEKRGKAFNQEDVEKEMKGGWFARWFRKPSREFKDFMQALKDYNDPTRKGYLNKDALAAAGNKYLSHVENNGGLNPQNMNSTRKARFELVQNTIASLNDIENSKFIEKLEDNLVKSCTINEVVPAVEAKEVEVENNKEVVQNINELEVEVNPNEINKL